LREGGKEGKFRAYPLNFGEREQDRNLGTIAAKGERGRGRVIEGSGKQKKKRRGAAASVLKMWSGREPRGKCIPRGVSGHGEIGKRRKERKAVKVTFPAERLAR